MTTKAQFDALAAQINADLDMITPGVSGPFINAGAYPSLQAATDAAAAARTTLYIPPGDWPITQTWKIPGVNAPSNQNFFNVVGAGMYQTRIMCNNPDPDSIGVNVIDWKGSHMSGFTVHNTRARDGRHGLVFGGLGPGTRSGQGQVERICVENFSTGISTSGGPDLTSCSSELSFDTIVVQYNDIGFFNNNWNALNHNVKNFMASNNGVGMKAYTAGCYVSGGAASANGIDFQFGNGGTSTVRDFRSEDIVDKFLVCAGTITEISNCVALRSVAQGKIIQSSDLNISNSLLNGYISLEANHGFIEMTNTWVDDPTNDAIVDNPTSSFGMGPGFHSLHASHFNCFGNYRWGNTRGGDSRFVSGIGYIDQNTRVATYDVRLTDLGPF